MVDIKLLIVEKECVRSTRNSQVWSVIGSDGNDFITISFWEVPIVEKFARAFGQDFVVGFLFFKFLKVSRIRLLHLKTFSLPSPMIYSTSVR